MESPLISPNFLYETALGSCQVPFIFVRSLSLKSFLRGHHETSGNMAASYNRPRK